MRARLAAHARWSREANRTANARRGQDGLLARFEREVDPDGLLPEGTRRKLAESARRKHMTSLAYKSSRARAA
ncbi:hypothetical protein [Jiangella sp. DSM 45060]|uniref:hypothetical protein n=1 Tax=Jiangella sp. DSM 45060 TaxID=1798224 RepID=UPI0018D4C6C0|nr:hypothetical protein [Jiangella sp. DSM 45060]